MLCEKSTNMDFDDEDVLAYYITLMKPKAQFKRVNAFVGVLCWRCCARSLAMRLDNESIKPVPDACICLHVARCVLQGQ